MNNLFTKSGIRTKLFVFFSVLAICTNVKAQQAWPCAQYLTRQVPNGSAFRTNISYVYTLGSGVPPVTVTVAKLDTLLNASVMYNGYIWAWKQYQGTAQSGSAGARLIKVSCNNLDSTVTPTITGYNFPSITMGCNAAFVDPNGIYYVVNTATSGASSFVLSRIDLTTATPTLLSNLTVNLPLGSTVASGGLGDMVYTPTGVYTLVNNTGLFNFTLPSTSTTTVSALLTGSINRTIGSLFYISSDPLNIYGYGSTAGGSTQDRIVKISVALGVVTELTTSGIAVSQSDGAGCPSTDFTQPSFYSISGTVYDDTNGSSDNTVNGTGTNGGGLSAVLYDGILGIVVAKSTVAANGIYTFSNLNAGTYGVKITTNSATVGTAAPAVALSSNWVSTAEKFGSGTGSDGTADGILSLGAVLSNVTNANFGIEQLPTANAVTGVSQVNPGGTTTVVVPILNGTDPEQGAYPGTGNLDTIKIITLPANATLYYNGVAATVNQVINNYNPSLLTVDPNDGAITVSFTYKEMDAALQLSAAATVSMNFTTIGISGNVYDDANALQDATVNGTGTNASGVLYAQLLNNSNAVIATTAVASNGSYSFTGLNGGTYSVLINNSSSASTATTLPSNWINTGEYIGTGTGNDGTVNGKSANIVLSSASVTNVNFGVEQLPTANAVTATSQVNPGGTTTVVVPTLNGTDPEQGTFAGTGNLDTVKIITLPSNGTLYYNGVAAAVNQVINNYNPALLTLDPNDGAITVTFTYAEIDAALQASGAATVSMSFSTIGISGSVYDDANALQDATVNGTGTNAGSTLYAQLLNSSNAVVATTAVAADGTYSFIGLNGGTYSVLINNSSSSSTATTLPSNWINTGEFIGTGVGNDGTVNGKSANIVLSSASVTNVNFGVEQLPTANAVTATSQVNPGGSIQVTVPTLNGSDPEQGSFSGIGNVDTVKIITLPSNGTLYYNGVAVTANQIINNYNPSLLTVDPNDGAITLSFTYAEVDAALQVSSAASVNMPFGTVVLSGNVYDDANALQDATVNGTGTNAGGTLYAQLLNSGNAVIATSPIASNGSFSFVNLNAGTYSVLINTSSSASNSTTLPSNWINTGEFNGTGVGNDGTVNGTSVSIVLAGVNVSNINFGIEQLPTANAVTAVSQVNPGGTNTVIVPTLNGTDPEQGGFPGTGNVDTVKIITLPSNGTLYYNGVAVTANQVINNYNPSLLTVDPNDGAITVSFTYKEMDAALQLSAAATVSIDFTTVGISGTIYDDANALQDGIVNGIATNASGVLYAQLLNSSNAVIATTAIASNGTYSFAGLNGGTYSVLINNSSSASTATTLPSNWINTGEFIGAGAGSDGTVNGKSNNIVLSSASVTNVNFGVEQLPTANAVTATSQVNPGGTIKVTVPTLNGTDPEQGGFSGIGNLDTVKIITLPSNGTLYYNGVAVTANQVINNYDPSLLTADPNDGAITVSFTYAEVDAALQLSAAATVSMSFSTIAISGNVYDDANALQDNTINGTSTNASGALYAQLLNSSNTVIATTAIASNGTYSFAGLNGGTYTVLINTSSSASTATTLPTNWLNTGEFNGTGVGNDGTVDGKSALITLSALSVANVNFGIEQLPTANAVTATSQVNPGGAIQVTVPALNGTDPEQGSFPGTGNLDTVKVITLPSNGTLYYNGATVTVNQVINNYDPSLLKLDPIDGAITVTFAYAEIDAALQVSTAATVSMSFTTIAISGNVYDDANALQDGIVNGAGTNASGALYAQLLNSSNTVIATTAIASNGTYSFTGLNGGIYSVLINISSSASTSTTLPTNWLNTGEFIGTGAGSDGIVNGESAGITLSALSVTNVNFGIEQLPTANAVTATSQVNPGGSIQVTAPTLNGADAEQGIFAGTGNVDTVKIISLPSNGVLYYNGATVTVNQVINNYNPSLLTLDPNDGAITVSFTYAEIDAALQSSAAATVSMSFTTIAISGNVYDDANALLDNKVNGIGTNAGSTLYAQLLDNSSTVIATTAVAANGTYSFAGLNGGTYSVIINNSSSASIETTLPNNWINTGEFNGTGVGDDGLTDGTSVSIILTTTSVTNVNFGIEQLPTANAVTAASQVNPGGVVKVTVPTLNGSDPEQGTFAGTGNLDSVIIAALPTNAVLYYNNVAVVAGDTIKNYNPSLLTLDPNDGAITVSFTYTEIDAALQSSAAATVSMSFTTIAISGNVYDDANALQDATVNGAGTNAGGTLYAQLLNSSSAVIATRAVAADGTYSFAGLNGGTYSVIINNASSVSTVTTLPNNWINTGEFIGTGAGNDGAVNGTSSTITLSSASVSNVNFGVEQLPTANAATAVSQVNPGGTVKVTVPTLNGADFEQGSFPGTGNVDTVKIITLPSNGTLYYNGVAATVNQVINNYNPSLLTLDPNDGAIMVNFTYSEIDAALQSSAAATVSMSFTTIAISGNVYDDANALQDAKVNGVGTNADNTLHAQLLNSSNTVIATTNVAVDGTYSFAGLNGGVYSVVLNTSASASAVASVPAGWLNTGEYIGTSVGNDGTVNGISASIILSTTSVTNVNFGVEQLPNAYAVTGANQVNPGGTVKVVVPILNGDDPEQGSFSGIGNLDTVKIITLPVNATLYYNGVAVTANQVINNYNPTLLTVDPIDGPITVSFTYVEIDAALQSSAAATVNMPFGTVILSGNVYDDANALQDGIVNGDGTNAGGTLYAQLLNSSNTVIATTVVASNGSYSFTNLNAGNYSVIINTSSSASTSTTLPTNWINTGEFNGTGVGNDGSVNGTSSIVTLSGTNIGNINFGIEQLPTANAITAASQVNPGGTVKVTVPTLNGADFEQGGFLGTGNVDTVKIITLPSNGTLYYNGIAAIVNQVINNYDPSLLMLDPNDGAITVSFTYEEMDAALQLSAAATVSMSFSTVGISGNVYDDANALQDATVNGVGTNAGNTLYAQLLNSSNAVMATTAIAADGTYSFAGLNGGTYTVLINTSSSASTATTLPTNWLNTGEFKGTGVGNDGTVNGTSTSIILSSTSVTNVNFGVEQLPTANAVTAASQVNPGGLVKVTVPTLNGSDPEQGTFSGVSILDSVIIKTLPTNAVLYYNNVAVVAGDTIKNYNPSLLTVDPNDGAITISFTYTEIDAALQSSAAAAVSMSYSTIAISGTVYDDANALEDGLVNGTGTNASSALYAQLLNNSNTVIATTVVASNGTYSFAGLNGGTYSVIINNVSSASTATTLPNNWLYTGEHNGTGAGNDGLVDGTSASIILSTTSVTNVNFGIEQLPTANAVTAASQVNPGGAIKVTVPTLNGSDFEQGSFSGIGNADTVKIITLPTNGTLYYNGVAVSEDQVINNYNPSLLTLDPNDGAITVSFTYQEMDAALQLSSAATVSMDFTTVGISGNVYDDANALQDNKVNGTGTNASGTLYAQLLNNSSTVIATTTVASNGTYSFAGLNGGTYSVIINNSSSVSTATTLPNNWLNTGEFNGTGIGNDGAVNGISAIITLTSASVSNVNFGLEQLPTANAVTAASQVNPGGSVKVTVPTLNGTDPEQGIFAGTGNVDSVIIKTLPTNASLYYNNVAVVAGDTIKNYNPSLLTLDPNDGAITVNFTYTEIDAALQSSASATVSMDFTTIAISGNVYDDANALQDGIVNGTGTDASNQLYAQLLNSSNAVIATSAIASDGTYSFAGLNGGTYSVLINISSSASTATTLPTNWLYTGEFNGTGVGNDGAVNGKSATITLTNASVSNVNFGVEQLPIANAVTAASQVNPGGSVKVTVPTLNGSDVEQGIFAGTGNVDSVIIKTLPTSGTLYYNNVAVVAGDTIKNYNPLLLTVNPNDGAITASFTYTEIDAALQSSESATVSMDFTTIAISGNVYDDANALQDGMVNGDGTNAGGTLYAHLLHNGNTEIAASAVAADGTYSFVGLSGGTYTVLINTSASSNSGASLPAGWLNTGEFNGAGSGNDGITNGVSSSIVLSTNSISNINFGIEFPPVANDVTAPSQVNLGGTVKVTVPTLNGSDLEDGGYNGISGTNTVIINSLPTNAILYYNNIAVVTGDTIKNYDPSLLKVDPNSGAITVTFNYTEVDAALQSSTQALVSMPFSTVSISGYVFDDGNGLQDSTVNGPGTNADDKVYVLLLDNTNSILATYFVSNTGYYIFDSLDAGTSYTVSVGQMTSPKITPYIKTGENLGTGPGNDGNVDGILHIGLISTHVTNANFGIEQIPYADLAISIAIPNPGGTTKVTVPVLHGSDPEDDIYDGVSGKDTIIIKTLPTNGILYYNGVAVAAGDTIKNYEPSLLTVDPANGAVTVNFNYSEVDAALQSSVGTTVSMPFTTLELSGNVYDDANALQDATLNGVGTNAGNQLYAQLLNSSNVVIATTAVAPNGTYNFVELDGGTYSVLINTSSLASTATTLPSGWVNTGEFNGVGVGNDGNVNGKSASVTLTTASVSNVNFGIEQTPTATAVTAVSQVNPGGTVKVTVPTLNGSDPEQGNFIGTNNADTIIIKTLPTNGILYYNNVAIVAGDTIKNYNPSLLMVDPYNGSITLSFTYKEIDAALQSSPVANVSMLFTTLTLSGNVYDDANALQDGIVNGSGVKGSDIDPLVSGSQKLYVQLFDDANVLVAATMIQNNGSYGFTGLDAGTYTVLLSQSATVSSTTSSLSATSSLPNDWINIGENLGTGVGNDGTINGALSSIILNTTNVTNANLGIQKTPVANNVSAYGLFNPGGTITVPVPVLNGSDYEDGVYSGFSNTNKIVIQTLPTNGKLYYDNVAVIAGDTIKNYDPSLLNVDPNEGFVTIVFTYSEVDAANVTSKAATVTMPFGTVLPITLSTFTGKMNNTQAELNWVTETEVNSGYFEVERSSDGMNFVTVGKVTAKGTAASYQFTDPAPANGFNCYRLKMVDKNGKIIYSKIVTVKSAASIISISSVKPNPFVNSIDVYVDLQKGTEITTMIFDENGKTVYQNSINGTAGVNWINVKNLDKLSTGLYVVQVTAGNNVVQKKIMKGK